MKKQNRSLAGAARAGLKLNDPSPGLKTAPLSPVNLPNHVIFKRYAIKHNPDLDGAHMNDAERAMNREYLPNDYQ